MFWDTFEDFTKLKKNCHTLYVQELKPNIVYYCTNMKTIWGHIRAIQ